MKKNVKKLYYAMIAIGLALMLFSASILISTNVANAAVEEPVFPVVSETCLDGWYVNPDEGDRLPTPSASGLTFVGNDLVHHATDIPLADLEPGTFVATPTPSLESFFSVEIINGDGTGYATLRLGPTGWFIGGPKAGTYAFVETDPANFIGKMSNWGEIATDSTVVSFGVGYVNTPNDGTETLVTEVAFAGTTYSMLCVASTPTPTPTTESPTPTETETTTAPPTTTSTTPTATPTTTTLTTEPTTAPTTTPLPSETFEPLPTTSQTPIPVVNTSNTLPVTGSSTAGLLAVGILLILVGASVLIILFVKTRHHPKHAQF